MPDPGMGIDLIYGGPDEEQPDWRAGDNPDAGVDDNDDPTPIDPKVLIEMIGFDPDEEEWD